MVSMYINTSVDSKKKVLEPTRLRLLTDIPSALKSMTSVPSSLFDETGLLTCHGGASIRELVSSTTAWPLVLVQRKHIDGPLVDMTCSPSKSPIGQIFWSEDAWKQSNLWDFYSTKAQTLGPGQFRALAREHVFVLQYKCPVDGRPGDLNLRLLHHRSGILIQKRALKSDIRRHYTGHDTFKFMAGVETLKEVQEVRQLQVDPSSTFTWGTDC